VGGLILTEGFNLSVINLFFKIIFYPKLGLKN